MDNYTSVTEIAGDKVSSEQVDRITNRYCWAKQFCKEKDVLEVACGSGQGLGMLYDESRSLTAGDYSSAVLQTAIDYYQNRIPLEVFDAQDMPFSDKKFDVIIIFEAIYYLPNFADFLLECRRVLKSGGTILISMPNVLLADFNKSPYSYEYFSITELKNILQANGFESQFFGYLDIGSVSIKQKLFRPIKKMAANLGLIPKTMSGKKLLKRIVFGKLVSMPNEICPEHCKGCGGPDMIDGETSSHKVIYCAAKLNS